MDHPDFDELTIGVATASNRRQLLKRLAAGLAIAVGVGVPASSFLPHGIGDAAARCRVDGSACSKNSDCCGRICLPKNANGHRYCATATVDHDQYVNLDGH